MIITIEEKLDSINDIFYRNLHKFDPDGFFKNKLKLIGEDAFETVVCKKCNNQKFLFEIPLYYRESYRNHNLKEVICSECKIDQQRLYYKENNKYYNKYHKQRRKKNPIYRLTNNIRGSIRQSLKNKGYSKKTNTYKILGLEYEDFYTWLNTEASNGLSFDKDDVHVDHVIPVSFGKTEEQVLALNHYSNLQLLTSEENKNKSNTYIKQSNLNRVMTHHPNNSILTKILLNYDYLIF